jgi:hypothetical protein
MDLPMEILAEILSNLEWGDVLHARQVHNCFTKFYLIRLTIHLGRHVVAFRGLLFPDQCG